MKRYSLDYGMSFGHCTADMNEDDDGEWVKAEDLPGWQPIESAPKDGRYILVYHTMPIIARWYVHFRNGEPDPHRAPEWDCRCVSGDAPPVEPTHWIPLPEPPK